MREVYIVLETVFKVLKCVILTYIIKGHVQNWLMDKSMIKPLISHVWTNSNML